DAERLLAADARAAHGGGGASAVGGPAVGRERTPGGGPAGSLRAAGGQAAAEKLSTPEPTPAGSAAAPAAPGKVCQEKALERMSVPFSAPLGHPRAVPGSQPCAGGGLSSAGTRDRPAGGPCAVSPPASRDHMPNGTTTGGCSGL